MLQPIALEEQARELLKAGDFDQALQLVDVAAGEGGPWVEDAYAEAAFLLIHGGLPSRHASFTLSHLSMHLMSWSVPQECLHAGNGKGHPCFMQLYRSEQGSVYRMCCACAELRFREAVDVLLRCSTSTVQPGELFPLFPEHTRPWAGCKLQARQHWGLHPPLADLETLIDRLNHSKNSYSSARENGNTSVKRRMAAAARQCVADYLLEVWT